MNPERKKQLENAGIDVGQALERMMGSEALLERLLGKFPADQNFQKLCRALECGDSAGAVSAAHTLKGICGNLSMTSLFELFTKQVEALRRGDLTEAGRLMEEIRPAYEEAVKAIGGDGDESR